MSTSCTETASGACSESSQSLPAALVLNTAPAAGVPSPRANLISGTSILHVFSPGSNVQCGHARGGRAKMPGGRFVEERICRSFGCGLFILSPECAPPALPVVARGKEHA